MPAALTVPASGCTSPASTLSRVDLPTPFGPTTAIAVTGGDRQACVVQHGERPVRDADASGGQQGHSATLSGSFWYPPLNYVPACSCRTPGPSLLF